MTNEKEVIENGTKVRNAKSKKVPVVSEKFLTDCIAANSILNISAYVIKEEQNQVNNQEYYFIHILIFFQSISYHLGHYKVQTM